MASQIPPSVHLLPQEVGGVERAVAFRMYLLMKRSLAVVAMAFAFLMVTASGASAHNSLSGSTPSEGSSLLQSPSEVSLRFTKEVALDTLTARLQIPDGSTTKLADPQFGSAGNTEAVFSLPVFPAGGSAIRWKIVGADGHPVTGEINFTVNGASAEPAALGDQSLDSAEGAQTEEGLPLDANSILADAPTSSVPRLSGAPSPTGSSEPWTAPEALRWLLRYGSYLALLLVAGIVLTDYLVWNQTLDDPLLRQCAAGGILAAAIASFGQLLVIATDIDGIGSLGAALQTDAGVAFAARILLLGVVATLLFVDLNIRHEHRDLAALVSYVLLFGTWAYAGHSRSMRWPILGVPLDVAHHIAAAAWLGGLGVLTFVTIPHENRKTVVASVRRFANVAAFSVAVIVGTGVVQAIRLVGSPGKLLSVNHGRYLLVKLVVLGAMLLAADVNRKRVASRFQVAGAPFTKSFVRSLRLAMRTEFFIGLLILGITSAMVVSPPAVASESNPIKPKMALVTPGTVDQQLLLENP